MKELLKLIYMLSSYHKDKNDTFHGLYTAHQKYKYWKYGVHGSLCRLLVGLILFLTRT